MEKKLRAWLLQQLGTEKYLGLVSNVYIKLINAGFMKHKYPELFYLSKIVKPGFVCIDIGANVGYYTTQLSKICGPSGHVHAVEPVKLFQTIFTLNINRLHNSNITLHPVALGGQNGSITMGTPIIDGVFRHGLTHVVEPNEDTTNMHTYTVNMCTPDDLFLSMERLDFIKCDVEGYEVVLMPHFATVIKRFKPTIQIELGSENNRSIMLDLFKNLGYQAYKLSNNNLIQLELADALKYDGGDFYFN